MGRYLIVGLGNPGSKYEGTRHNVGFDVADRLARRHRIRLDSEKFDGRCDTGIISNQKVTLLKPMDFMNRSGGPVQQAANFYDVPDNHIVVIHDDIDLDVGAIRLKEGGGHGGHNGLRDIVDRLGSSDFLRVRLGVGRPEHGDVTNHVLSGFSSDERADAEHMIDDACHAVEMLLSDGLSAAQNHYHSR